jgi:hypothetical protein
VFYDRQVCLLGIGCARTGQTCNVLACSIRGLTAVQWLPVRSGVRGCDWLQGRWGCVRASGEGSWLDLQLDAFGCTACSTGQPEAIAAQLRARAGLGCVLAYPSCNQQGKGAGYGHCM